ncbi:Synaptonemal complex protein 1 [Heracleum sosnowskyi]|uniref:Synaptonemal complex protein 1 n=1 Tax=Heracleum sosnowskyi TaxID=360622 RepID=A0AAD8HUP5_9APIA|nr:Synaptonemal complex protein 1 [Heracleum sosnowskyi]
MNKLVGLSGLKSLEHFRSYSGAAASKTFSSSPRPSDSVSLGSFANLKLTAEKLVKEQASAKTDLDLANCKLKKLTEHISILEAKLQNAFNENAKLKVRQKEDEKLWRGLESKFSSTKALCDQISETLQLLAAQVQEAEKDKVCFENKLAASGAALDRLNDAMKSLSLKLESSSDTIRNCEKKLQELSIEKEEREKSFVDERSRFSCLIEDKDIQIKRLEETIVEKGSDLVNLNCKFERLQIDFKSKEDHFNNLSCSKEKLENEKVDLLSCNQRFANKLDVALGEIKNLEHLVNILAVSLTELDNQSLTISDNFKQLSTSFDICFKLAQEGRDLGIQSSQKKYDELHDRFVHATSEKDELYLVNQDLRHKVTDFQKEREFTMVQHAEECRIAEERILALETKAEGLLSRKNDMESLISGLEEKLNSTAKNAQLSEKRMQESILKISELEIGNKDNCEKLQEEIQKKEEDIDILKKEIEKHEQSLESQDKKLNQFEIISEERDTLIQQQKEKEKELEDEKAKFQELLVKAENNLAEAKKQHDQMLESKQLELSRRLKEISQKNDQAINDIRRKYEVEKLESINLEKEKAGKAIEEMQAQCDQKLAECKEESKQYLKRIQEEQAGLISRIQQEHDEKETNLIFKHGEQIKCANLQAENELREKTMSMRKEHDAQLRALRDQHKDECRQLQEELDVQRTKEERQRALLQLQWKVMSDHPEEDQEVESKKNYSIPASKTRNSNSGKSGPLAVVREEQEEDSPYPRETQTPVLNILKKSKNENTGSMRSIPKHSKKVTRREYEIETSNGRTITKRRRTKSTVMFEDPEKRRSRRTPRASTPRTVVKGIKGGGLQKPSNIGDLFSEGSLNPYADDPYAFD